MSNIPNASEVSSGGRSAWRIANGCICKGSEDNGTLEVHPDGKIVGELRRVGIHFGTKQDGTAYGQAEIDVETANGPDRVKVSLTDLNGNEKGSSAALSFLWGALQVAKDELFILEAVHGKEHPKYKKKPTYANFYTLAPGSRVGKPVAKRPKDESDDLDAAVMKLREELKSHPAYADRPASESDDDEGNATTHLSALCKEMETKGWASPEQDPATWLAIVSVVEKSPAKATLSAVSDDTWGALRLDMQQRSAPPKLLAEAMAAKAKPIEGLD